ncbi:MAG: hypothetical protein HYY52_07190 [Candidatus Melainabacteria bacterium]|nr:hypothetical protein [Candidatus Melainabacteria bacterium]
MKNSTLNSSLALAIILNFFSLILAPSFAFHKFSKKQEEILNKLIETTKPTLPIFDKLDKPIKGYVSFSKYLPSEHHLKETTLSSNENLIKLEKETSKSSLSELELRRKELQKAEEQGLNFIQPSIQLTPEEQVAIDEFFSRNEQEQLLNLWKATIERNKTIQFIIQKLSPANSPQQASSFLSRTLGAAIFLPFYALQALTNNAGAYYGSQVGGRVLGSVIEGKMQKDKSLIQLSQTETIILFMMIDEVAERLRQRYHNYKRLMVERSLATNELEEAKKDILDAHETNSQETQVLTSIQRRAVEREIRRLDAGVRAEKNALIELAGLQAVSELDEQLQLELAATQNTPLDF